MKVCNHRAEKLGKNGLKSVYNLKLGEWRRKACILGSHGDFITQYSLHCSGGREKKDGYQECMD